MLTGGEFEDRRERLFGRSDDLNRLIERSKTKGITIVTGRPRMGKSWLLEELCRKLVEMGGVNVGYTRASGGAFDLPLQCASDLYARWLGNAGPIDQIRRLYEQKKGDMIGTVGVAFGKILASFDSITPVGRLIEDGFKCLAAADRDLKSGGLNIAPISYEQVRNLANNLNHLSDGAPSVLVLDQWEDSQLHTSELAIFKSFLDQPNDWKPCHILLAVRDEGATTPTLQSVRKLQREHPTAAISNLDDIICTPDEETRMLDFVRQEIEAARDVDGQELLVMIGGYPGVIDHWLNSIERPRSVEDLEKASRQAHGNRFTDLEKALKALNADELKLATRLAFMPRFANEDSWKVYETVVLDGIPPELLIRLQSQGILEPGPRYPSFGHPRRRETVQQWFLAEDLGFPIARAQCERLIVQMAARIRSIEPSGAPFAIAISFIHSFSDALGLSRSHQCMCVAAKSLLALDLSRTSIELIPDLTSNAAAEHPSAVPLLAMGLVNTLNHAKAEDDLTRRDALLDELRALARDHPADAAVREQLAKGLFNTLNHAKAEQRTECRDRLFEEIRSIRRRHPDERAPAIGYLLAFAEMLRDLDESAAREFFVQNEEDHKDIAQRFPDLLQTGKPSEEG